MQLALLIVLIVFVIDLFVPEGVAASVPHILGVMATLTSNRRRDPIIVAVLATFFTLSAEWFSPGRGDTELWKVMFNRFLVVTAIWATALVIYLRATAMNELARVSKQLKKELNYASRLQERLYPKESPKISGLDIAGFVEPAEQLCGDYYDYLEMNEKCIGFVIGDVSGHGIGQSIVMSDVRSTLRGMAKSDLSLGEILTKVNLQLVADTPDDIFVTLMLVKVDPESMTFSFASAGHCSLLIRASGECEVLRSGSLALGLSEHATYSTEDDHMFNVGDTLILATDGLEERHSPEGELFGRDRILQEVSHAGPCSSEQLIKRLVTSASTFARGETQHDDITMVIIRRSSPLMN
ncbi:MAG: serine/threonine-protein phosphatase [Planctomycetaceae bacterium]|nr:serine/threonine-protein phosphatase [Planctomycetaceae bacterium]